MNIKIITWKIDNDSHPYPYRFALDVDGERRDYIGISNQCETKRSAIMRAVWKKRWILRGDDAYIRLQIPMSTSTLK